MEEIRIKFAQIEGLTTPMSTHLTPIASFLFLNLYCPSIIFPERFGLLNDRLPSDKVRLCYDLFLK
jgi:hypothetical protein